MKRAFLENYIFINKYKGWRVKWDSSELNCKFF